MTGYMDRTWCPLSINKRCSRSRGCYRAFTEQDHKRAVEWWGGDDYPLGIFREEPDCFIPFRIYESDGEL